MRGVVFTGNRTSEIREFPDPQAGPGDAVIKVRASGLCGSDLHRYRTPDPTQFITGHEPCGDIVELGPGAPPGLKVGDRVMVHHYAGCGACEICSMGFEQACPSGHETYGGASGHGANSDYMLIPSRTLVPLPDELSYEAGASIACGTGTAWSGLRKMGVSGHDTVAVFGQGPVGLAGTQSAKAMGARVIAVDIVPERLALATQVGADHVVNSSEVDAVEAIRDLTGGGVSASLETSGNPIARTQVLKVLRLFGRAAYVGMGGDATIDINLDVIRNVTTIYGSWTFSKSELSEIARFMIDGNVPVDDVVTHRFPLEEAVEAFEVFDSATTGKCMIVMD